VLPLHVSAPFHCRLMAPLRDEMAAALAQAAIQAPRLPIIANVTADVVRTPEEIRHALADQIAGAVRWTATLHRLAARGTNRFVEVGAGKALTGLVRRTLPSAEALTYEQLLPS
jgi:[acyl-carrier-protein] S-malonyltransferase